MNDMSMPAACPRDAEAAAEAASSRFIEHMGLASEEDGLPRIAGRMWGFFVLHGGPVSFAELADQLEVSRGSISTNARILRDRGIIERVAVPGDRQDYYQLTDQPFDRMLQIYLERMRRTEVQARELRAVLPAERDAQIARLDDMIRFYQHTAAAIAELLRRPRADTSTEGGR